MAWNSAGIFAAKSQIPIIVLSVRGEERTKVEALDAGADDYVTKPFSTNELLARVRAALRRAVEPCQQPDSQVIEVGDFRIDLQAHSVHVRNQEVKLTPKEFDVLAYLARHPGKVVTHRASAGRGLGRHQHGAAGIPARRDWPPAQEA